MNVAARSPAGARQLRDWLVESDSVLDPQAYVLRPDVVLRIAGQLLEEKTAYGRTRRAVLAALEELRRAHEAGLVRIPQREVRWLDSLQKQADALPEDEGELTAEFLDSNTNENFLPVEYAL
jgi:methanol--5-hydroxybenzimidazolylcobamide Co-methyltransferase